MDKEKIEILEDLKDSFLKRWSLNRVKKMKLNDYVIGSRDKDSFSYWLELETKQLGNISGIGNGGSFKHIIFKPQKKKKYSKKSKFTTNGNYSWRKSWGSTPQKAFKKLKKKIVDIIAYSLQNRFDLIENEIEFYPRLIPEVGWKIVYLYSKKGRVHPFFEKSLLLYAVKSLGDNKFDLKSTRSDMQLYIYKNKPKHLDVYEFADLIWKTFPGRKSKKKNNNLSDEFGEEGGLSTILRQHLAKEKASRNLKNIQIVKKGVKNCEACNVYINKFYSLEKHSTILEVHHILPIRFWREERIPTRDDYAVLCPSCHRAIHKHMAILKTEKIVLKEFKKLAKL